MVREIFAVADVPVALSMLWLTSLRRTPFKNVWTVIMPAWMIGGMAASLGAAASGQIGLSGVLAIQAAVVAIPAITAGCTEICATEDGEIKRWREKRSPSDPLNAWKVKSEATYSGLVKLHISDGDTTKEIGQADPIEDQDEFMNLRARAETAAETYNTLQIGA